MMIQIKTFGHYYGIEISGVRFSDQMKIPNSKIPFYVILGDGTVVVANVVDITLQSVPKTHLLLSVIQKGTSFISHDINENIVYVGSDIKWVVYSDIFKKVGDAIN